MSVSRRVLLLPLVWIAALQPCAQSAPIGPGDSVALAAMAHAVVFERLPGSPIEQERSMLDSLYPASGARLLWSDQRQLSRQARELLDILASSESFGLRSGDYLANGLSASAPQLSGNPAASDWQQFDVRLSRAAIHLISHLHFGRIDPRTAGFELPRSHDTFNVATEVVALANAPTVVDTLRSMEPPFVHYALLQTALPQYRALAADPALTRLPRIDRRTLHAGDEYVGTPVLRRLLLALQDIAPAAAGATTDSSTLDAELVAGIRHFQARHGLTADGTLGPQTYLELTTPLAQRVRQIELTLERWRWLPTFDSPPIIVNIPQFRLYAFATAEDRGRDSLQMPVIVGQAYPRTQTPVFVGDMRYVIFRPYWDIPRSIMRREMLPHIQADIGYLSRNHLELVNGQSDNSPVVVPTREAVAALAAGKLRLRQQPGDDNALGPVKFVFPNTHDVYMHGTPAQHLFLQSRRAFSHGCIRVHDPVALARYVLRNTAGNWDEARILAAMRSSTPLRVEIRQPIHVMILYGTALATEAGPIDFFDDIYGQDRRLETLLGLSPLTGAK